MRPPAGAGRVLGWVPHPGQAGMRRLGRAMRPLVWDRVFGGRFDDRKHALQVLKQHARDVQRHVPRERLLVYEVSQGWPPLCEFLGVPVPSRPFPWVDDAESLRQQQREQTLRALSVPVGITVAVLAAGVAGALAIRRRRPVQPPHA
jgi:hypothetical protein